jgi:hypothetical protein
MKTKVLALTVTTTMLAFASFAQDEGTTFGIRAGVNFQNLNGKDYLGNKLERNKLKVGFNAGVNAEVPVAPDFYVQPGVLFSTKGAKSKDDEDVKINISYIEIPINFLYKPMLGTGKLLLGIGPYVAFGIGGKFTDASGKDTDIEFKKEITAAEFLNSNSNIYAYTKRFDAGGNFLVGYELSSKISAQLNAQLGLVNINPDIEGVSNDKTKVKNTGFGVSLGYRF